MAITYDVLRKTAAVAAVAVGAGAASPASAQEIPKTFDAKTALCTLEALNVDPKTVMLDTDHINNVPLQPINEQLGIIQPAAAFTKASSLDGKNVGNIEGTIVRQGIPEGAPHAWPTDPIVAVTVNPREINMEITAASIGSDGNVTVERVISATDQEMDAAHTTIGLKDGTITQQTQFPAENALGQKVISTDSAKTRVAAIAKKVRSCLVP